MKSTKRRRASKKMSKDQGFGIAAKKFFCGIFGHSRIVNVDWGRVCCARCDEFIVDGMTSMFDNSGWVLPRHVCGKRCRNCQDNWKRLKWHEKIWVKQRQKAQWST